MVNLLRVDFRRVIKDKLFLIMCILAVVFAVTLPLLSWAISDSMDPEMIQVMFGDMFTAKYQFFKSFAMGDNLGLIIPILIAIVLCKDFSQGTVRNKIISGHSRTSIFTSMFLVCAGVTWVIMLLQGLLALGVSLLLFEYQTTPFTGADFGYFLLSLAFEMLVYLFASALISWLCATMKNVGMVIVLYAAFSIGFILIGGIVGVGIMIMDIENITGFERTLLELLRDINIFTNSGTIGLGSEYTTREILVNTLVPILFTSGLLALGGWKFNKKDLK